jgi:hypothetical protein
VDEARSAIDRQVKLPRANPAKQNVARLFARDGRASEEPPQFPFEVRLVVA